jgi:hypothetical protein
MSETKKINIFHIYRKDGTSLFLHPMGKARFFLELLESADGGRPMEIKGLYGKEPRVESLTLFRNELYRLIELNVKMWAGEQRFLFRFLISTGFFLVVYFLLSMLIRDPIPMVDEVLLASGAAVALFFILGRKARGSDVATTKRIQLREIVDQIRFVEDPFLKKVETYLQQKEGQNEQTLVETFWTGDNPFNTEPMDGEVKELLGYLEGRFDKKLVNKFDKSLNRGIKEKPSVRSSSGKKLDLPLLSTYVRLKEHCLNK